MGRAISQSEIRTAFGAICFANTRRQRRYSYGIRGVYRYTYVVKGFIDQSWGFIATFIGQNSTSTIQRTSISQNA